MNKRYVSPAELAKRIEAEAMDLGYRRPEPQKPKPRPKPLPNISGDNSGPAMKHRSMDDLKKYLWDNYKKKI